MSEQERKLPTKLKRILAMKGMTQKELSDLTGLNIGQVSDICSGKRTNLMMHTAKKIAYVLNASLDDVFGDDE